MDRLILREDYGPGDAPRITGRTLTIRVATIGRVYTVAESGRTVLRERIPDAEAFREPLARPRGVLRFRHKGEHPGEQDDLANFHGVITGMALRDNAVYADAEVFPGPLEDRLLRLVDTGTITGASMAALIAQSRPGRDSIGPLTDIIRIRQVHGISITPENAYDDAGVVAIREAEHDPARERARQAAREQERRWWNLG
jgi:hypothetical protein